MEMEGRLRETGHFVRTSAMSILPFAYRLRTQTYFRLSLVPAEPVTAGNTSVFAGYFAYKLEESGRERVGHALGESIRRFRKKIVSSKDGRKRKEMKGKTWITLSVKPKCSS